MAGPALRFRLLPIAALFCVGSCLSTEGYYRYQDAGATGSAGVTGAAGNGKGGTTTGGGGSGSVLFMEDFEAGISGSKWDFGPLGLPPVMMDGTKVVNVTESAGDQKLGAAGTLQWTNYSVEAKVKVLGFTGTSSSDGVAICARLSGIESFYYLLLSPSSDTKALKIKINNSGNSSLSSSLDSSGFAVNTWVTLRLDVQGNTLTAYLNGTIKGTYTATGADILPMGGIGLMVQRATAEFDDIIVRALP